MKLNLNPGNNIQHIYLFPKRFSGLKCCIFNCRVTGTHSQAKDKTWGCFQAVLRAPSLVPALNSLHQQLLIGTDTHTHTNTHIQIIVLHCCTWSFPSAFRLSKGHWSADAKAATSSNSSELMLPFSETVFSVTVWEALKRKTNESIINLLWLSLCGSLRVRHWSETQWRWNIV